MPYVQSYYGVPRAGRLLTLINQRLRPEEQEGLLRAAEPALLLGDREYLDALDVDRLPSSIVRRLDFDSAAWHEVIGTQPSAGWTSQPGEDAWLLLTSGSTGSAERRRPLACVARSSGTRLDRRAEHSARLRLPSALPDVPHRWLTHPAASGRSGSGNRRSFG